MDFFQRLGNFFGGKGWVSDDEKRRKEQQQSAAPQPYSQPQPKYPQRQPQQGPKTLTTGIDQSLKVLQSRQIQNPDSHHNLVRRANEELNTAINDPTGYYKEDADKLRHEVGKGVTSSSSRIKGLLQSVQNRRKEISEQAQQEQQMRQRIASNPNEHRTQGQIDTAISNWRKADTARRSKGAFSPEQYEINQQIKGMRLGDEDNNQTVGEIIDDIRGSKGIEQAEKFELLDNKIKDLGEAFTDDKVQRRNLLMHARQEAEQYRQGDLGSLARGFVKGFVDMPKTAGEGIAMAIHAADGSRERLASSKKVTADYYARELQKAIRDGDERKKAYYSYELNRENREINNILERQTAESDPILNAGRVANAAATPVAFAAQATGAGVAAKVGATGMASNATRSTISQLITQHSPQLTGKIAQTTAGKVLNSTPAQIVSKVIPNASPRLQAVAAESMTNVLSGVPQSVTSTASESGSHGRLESYLINTATGVVMDAAFPVAAYGVGRGANYAGRGINSLLPTGKRTTLPGNVQEESISRGLNTHQNADVRYKLGSNHEAEIQAYNDHLAQLRLQESRLLEQGLSENSAPIINNRKAQAEAIYAREHIGEVSPEGVKYKKDGGNQRSLLLTHELSPENIKFSEKVVDGELLRPSLGITDPTAKVLDSKNDYGAITLVGDRRLAADRQADIYYGDGQTVRHPRVFKPDGKYAFLNEYDFDSHKHPEYSKQKAMELMDEESSLPSHVRLAQLRQSGPDISIPANNKFTSLDQAVENKHLLHADGVDGRAKELYQSIIDSPYVKDIVRKSNQQEQYHHKLIDASDVIDDYYRGDKSAFVDAPQNIKDLLDEYEGLILEGSPRSYFEAKLNRVVGLDEFKHAVIPNDLDAETRAILNKHNIQTIEYEAGNSIDRRAKLATLDEYKFKIRERVSLRTKQALAKIDTLTQRHLELTGDEDLVFKEWRNEMEKQALGYYDPKTDTININQLTTDTLNHELGHKLLRRAENNAELIATIRQTVGDEELLRRYGKDYGSDDLNVLAEEYLADGFSDYSRGILKGEDKVRLATRLHIPQEVIAVYDRIIEAIKGLVGKQDTIRQFYAQIETGKFRGVPQVADGDMRVREMSLDSNRALETIKKFDDVLRGIRRVTKLDTISDDVAAKITQATGIDVRGGAPIELTNQNAIHIHNRHIKNPSDPRPLEDYDIAALPEIIKDPDLITKEKVVRGTQRIKFEREMKGNKKAVVEVIKKGNALNVVTYFNDSSSGRPNVAKATSGYTSETGQLQSTNLDPNIANSPRIVNDKRFKIGDSTTKVEFKDSLEPKRVDIDEAIYNLHPELMQKYVTGKMLGRNGIEWDIPRIHVDDLAHYLGSLKENIPNYYKRRSGDRNIDVIAQEMGFDDIDEFLDRYTSAIDARRDLKDMKRTLSELRKDPEVLAEAKRIANAPRDEARTELIGLLAERQEYLEQGDIASVKAADEYLREVYKEAGAYLKSLPKVKKIQVSGREGKPVEYVAVTTSRGKKGEESFELIPLDGNKHTLKNGVVVDKDGRYVGSYVGIDEAGNQYAYIEGKPMNITALVGDIDAWGNKNSPFTDLNRLIEDNAPDTQTARRVQEFTTVFKDEQEAAMKTELANKRNELAKTRYEMMKNRPKGISKDELSADMFRIMERKIPYNEVVQKYGTEYIEKYIRPTVEFYRKELDEILASTNKVLEKNGYEPIPKRKNYISHIQENPSFWEKVGLGIQDTLQLGKSTSAEANPGQVRGAIPDEIVGKTANTGARKKWNRFAQQRRGSAHVQDFFAAIDAYYEPMLFNKYMTPAASRVRMIEDTFRSFEKAKQVQLDRLAEAIGADQARTELGDRQKTHKNYKADRRSPLVMAWMEYGNMLAGKTNAIDRMLIDNGFEKWIVDPSVKAQRIVGANVIPGSATAAVAQTLSLPQMIARDTLESVLLGAKDMLVYAKRSGKMTKDDPMLKSAFMRARYTDASPITKGLLRKATDKASIPMEAIERVTGEMNWRSAYREALRKGLKGMDAINDADIATKKTLAGRGIGDRPMVMNSKAAGALTQFGLEVLNMGVQFKRDFSVGQKTKFIAAAFALNELTNMVTGQRQLPDYISAIKESYEDFTKDDELDEDGKPKSTISDKFGHLGQRLLGETAKFIPGAGSLANLVMPDKVKEDVFGKSSDVVRFGNPAISRVVEAGHQLKEGITEGNLGKAADSGLMFAPMGQQVRRSIGGLGVMAEGVNRNSKGNVTSAVDRSNPVKWVQAGLFGKNALSEIRAGYLNNTKPLSDDQTKVYDEIRQKFGEDSAKAYLEDIHRLRESKAESRKAGVSGSSSGTDSKLAEATRVEAGIKLRSGEWREENGLIVDRQGKVQRSYYKSLAQSQGESDEAYDNWMKAYDIDKAGSKPPRTTGNPMLDSLQMEKSKVNKATTAINLIKDAETYRDLPAWVKQKYYEKSGYKKHEIEYGALASYGPKEKLYGYWLPKVRDMEHDQIIQELTNARRESIKGQLLATNGIIDNLAVMGVISKDEAKVLKRARFLHDGTPKTYSRGGTSGGGRGRSRSRSGGSSRGVSFSSVMEPFKQSVQMSKALNTQTKSRSSSPQPGQRQLKRVALRQWNPGSSNYSKQRLRSRSKR